MSWRGHFGMATEATVPGPTHEGVPAMEILLSTLTALSHPYDTRLGPRLLLRPSLSVTTGKQN